ncbi:2-dehydro-3-deoxy-6-phosphogalactonate aldolase [Aquabacterium sp.]|uniref:2-dehydro-3-deoxy-6-phosphogalactonate aldolase n=1 Tax=Aquabacterium sp. TaxID=1872578 RepID=UPI002CC0AFF1|nr:2-dehydro-3-deoxy-6-phosphogalactonate aldolase [Aquabacterium sp.]HSW08418.1 2-dehydro-3-deoxy-6-phosphogalactonate aldolase [Aquabacterium sp.]
MNPQPHWPGALPLVAILRGIRPEEAAAHARAVFDAGFDCIEVPTNSPDWPASLRHIRALAPPGALLGAGTVLDASHLDALQAAGGQLAVSPHVDTALITDTVRRGLMAVPGAMTASEVFAAWRTGARAVKLFPAATLGPGHVRALCAVLPPELPLLAVGGVTVDNLADYLRAGCLGAGLGGELYRPGQSPADTAQRAAAFVAAYRTASAAPKAQA